MIRADYVSAHNISIRTDASSVTKGTLLWVERFRADDIVYDLQMRKGHIRRILLNESNAELYGNPSPQPRKPFLNSFPPSLSIDDILLLHIGASLTNAQAETISRANRIRLHNFTIDTALQASLQRASIADGSLTIKQSDTPPWTFTQLTAYVDSLHYEPTHFAGLLTHIEFKESHGINLQKGVMMFAWQDGQIILPQFELRTEHSTLQGHLHTLDYKAAEIAIDGDVDIRIGYADALLLAKWTDVIPKEFTHLYPTEQLSASIAARGTLERLQLTRCQVSLPTAFDLKLNGTIQHITTPQKCIAQGHIEAKSYNLDFLNTFSDATTKDRIHIPQNITLQGDISYAPDTMHAQCLLTLKEGTASIEASYAPTNKAYTLHLQADSLDMHQISPNGALGLVSLQAHFTGNGTDYKLDDTTLRGALQLHMLQWKERNFTNITAQISVADKRTHVYASCNDSLMQWHMMGSAWLAQDVTEVQFDAQINHLDMQALQISDTDIRPALRCQATLAVDSGAIYNLHASFTDITLATSTQRLQPPPLTLQATLTSDTILLAIHSDDLTLSANAHATGFPWQWEQGFNPLDHLTHLHATLTAGSDNPMSNYLSLIGIKTDSLSLTAHYNHDALYGYLQSGLLTWRTAGMTLQGRVDCSLVWNETFTPDDLSGLLRLSSVRYTSPTYNLQLYTKENLSVPFKQGHLNLIDLPLYTTEESPLLLNGEIRLLGGPPMAHLRLTTPGTNLLQPQATRESLLYGKAIVSGSITMDGPFNALSVAGDLRLRPGSSIYYLYKDAILTENNQLNNVVTFVSFDTSTTPLPKQRVTTNNLAINLNISIDPTTQLSVLLGANLQNGGTLQGGGSLNLQYIPATGVRLAGKYTIESGTLSMNVPLLHVSNMTLRQGSTITWSGNPLNPMFDVTANERLRASVTLDGSPQSVLFVAGVSFTDTMDKLNMQFSLSAPENASMQNILTTLSPEERGKLAVALLTTGLYLGEGGTGNLMNTALMSILQSQIDNISRDAFRTVDVSVGIDPLPDGVSGVSTRTDYSFSIAKRLWNNRIRIIIGGSVTTNNERIEEDAVIDNISIEWRINPVGNQYLRFFYDKNYESILEGEIRETGVGYAYRRRF